LKTFYGRGEKTNGVSLTKAARKEEKRAARAGEDAMVRGGGVYFFPRSRNNDCSYL